MKIFKSISDRIKLFFDVIFITFTTRQYLKTHTKEDLIHHLVMHYGCKKVNCRSSVVVTTPKGGKIIFSEEYIEINPKD